MPDGANAGLDVGAVVDDGGEVHDDVVEPHLVAAGAARLAQPNPAVSLQAGDQLLPERVAEVQGSELWPLAVQRGDNVAGGEQPVERPPNVLAASSMVRIWSPCQIRKWRIRRPFL